MLAVMLVNSQGSNLGSKEVNRNKVNRNNVAEIRISVLRQLYHQLTQYLQNIYGHGTPYPPIVMRSIQMAQWEPKNELARAVRTAGFDYDPSQDIIYSRRDALQRKFGYAYAYDKYAFVMSATIDCEPIFFDYGGKTWMIELWKGQYSLETGCEIGIYNRNSNDKSFPYSALDEFFGKREKDDVPKHNLFFNCASDDEMLSMSFTLFHKGKKLFSRGPEKHWWLTAFKWGIYSNPADLRMEIAITFEHADMQAAFVSALQHMSYQNVQVTSNHVSC